jgi:DNA-directed RNA polymerase subunit omega
MKKKEEKRVEFAEGEGIAYPSIDRLLDITHSKYALVMFASKRARQINLYYSKLLSGVFENVGPVVESTNDDKPLTIALREIEQNLLDLKTEDELLEKKKQEDFEASKRRDEIEKAMAGLEKGETPNSDIFEIDDSFLQEDELEEEIEAEDE